MLSFAGSNTAKLPTMGGLLADRDDWHETVRVCPFPRRSPARC